MNIGQKILWCNSCHFDISILAQLNDCIGGLLHLGPNVITFRALLHLGPNVITFRTLSHLGQLLHLGLQQKSQLHKVEEVTYIKIRRSYKSLLSNLVYFIQMKKYWMDEEGV